MGRAAIEQTFAPQPLTGEQHFVLAEGTRAESARPLFDRLRQAATAIQQHQQRIFVDADSKETAIGWIFDDITGRRLVVLATKAQIAPQRRARTTRVCQRIEGRVYHLNQRARCVSGLYSNTQASAWRPT